MADAIAWLCRRLGGQGIRHAHLLDSSPAVIYACRPFAAGPGAKVTYIGEAVSELIGWPASAFLNDPMFWCGNIHPDDRDATLALSADLPRLGRTVMEYRFRHADGSWRWMRDELRMVVDADGRSEIVGSWFDITSRKRVEEALRQELHFEQSLLDALPYPVFQQDVHGRHFGCNSAFAQAFGIKREQVAGRTVFDLLPHEQAREIARFSEETLGTGTGGAVETTLTYGDGRQHRVVAVLAPFEYTKGVVAGLIGTIIDITGQKRTEEQLVQAAKLATLGQIASEVAHELNQPLSIIRMSAEACLQHSLAGTLEAERLQRKLGTIVQQVSRMAERVNHLRVFSRPSTGEKRAFAIVPVVEASVDLLRMQFEIDDIRVDRRMTMACPEVLGHPSQVEQVVLNLLSNARDAVRAHCPAGKRRVRVSVAETGDGGNVDIVVEDNGGGIADAILDQVFEPFFTTKSEGAGTGLGLSISANIVSAMGGSIRAANTADGARLIVTLPVHRHGAQGLDPDAPVPADQPDERPHWRVLVVDDEPLAVECVMEYLAERGYNVVGATGGREALAKARAAAIDVVVTDMRMPGMEGRQLVEQIRRGQPGVAAVMMTGHVSASAEPGPDPVVQKPVVLDELERCIAGLLESRTKP
ncbi:MAG: PAS domain S-box protein [Actinomycetota bacterium]